MLAEILLKVAADPNAVTKLSRDEMRVLFVESDPPGWVFAEAARRHYDNDVLTCLFNHPKTSAETLAEAMGRETLFLDRYQHHVNVYEGDIGLSAALKSVVPEGVEQPALSGELENLLTLHLPALCLGYLQFTDKGARLSQRSRLKSLSEHTFLDQLPVKNLPRFYSSLARFVLLGDFLHYLTYQHLFAGEVGKLPLTAKVALALNMHQPLIPLLNDADIRVRRAAQERQSWNAN